VTLNDIKKEINLVDYAKSRYGYKCDSKGKGHCPFHPPDNNPSFSIWLSENGIWRWKDHHDGISGTIVDFVARIEGISYRESINKLLREFSSAGIK
jgi:hypothetical protein